MTYLWLALAELVILAAMVGVVVAVRRRGRAFLVRARREHEAREQRLRERGAA